MMVSNEFLLSKLGLNACDKCLLVKMIYCENDLLTIWFSVYERFTAQSNLVSQNDLVPQAIQCQNDLMSSGDLVTKGFTVKRFTKSRAQFYMKFSG